MCFNDLGYHFFHVCTIEPYRDDSGKIIEYYPQDRYSNEKNLDLHRYGKGPFCKFRIPKGYSYMAGVYILVADNTLVYVGECEDLEKRWNMGYGNISPRNCFKGGQETNCRINNYILKKMLSECNVDIYFHETANRFNVESEFIIQLSPILNRTKNQARKRRIIQNNSTVESQKRGTVKRSGCREEILNAIRRLIEKKELMNLPLVKQLTK